MEITVLSVILNVEDENINQALLMHSPLIDMGKEYQIAVLNLLATHCQELISSINSGVEIGHSIDEENTHTMH